MRLPRPRGLTNLTIQIGKGKEELRTRRNKLLIEEYSLNNYQLFGHHYNIPEIAKLLGVTELYVIKNLTRATKRLSKLIERDGLEDITRALTAQLFFKSLEARGHVEAQMLRMLSSQGETYKPFVSSTVNDSMKTLLQADKNIMDLIKTVSGNQGLQVTINNQQNQQVETKAYLSQTEAIHMITHKGINDLTALDPEALFSQYQLENTPELRAPYQEGHQLQGETAVKKLTEVNKGIIDEDEILEILD